MCLSCVLSVLFIVAALRPDPHGKLIVLSNPICRPAYNTRDSPVFNDHPLAFLAILPLCFVLLLLHRWFILHLNLRFALRPSATWTHVMPQSGFITLTVVNTDLLIKWAVAGDNARRQVVSQCGLHNVKMPLSVTWLRKRPVSIFYFRFEGSVALLALKLVSFR